MLFNQKYFGDYMQDLRRELDSFMTRNWSCFPGGMSIVFKNELIAWLERYLTKNGWYKST